MNLDGSYSNEFEAAHDLSRREFDGQPDVTDIHLLVEAGRFVVVCEFPSYCVFTDAYVGMTKLYHTDFGTREEADAFVAKIYSDSDVEDRYMGEESYSVLPKLPNPEPVSLLTQAEEDECPF